MAFAKKSGRLEEGIRITYNAKAIHGIDVRLYLFPRLADGEALDAKVHCVLLYEWTRIGINSSPYGRPVLSLSYVAPVLEFSNAIYVGGRSQTMS